MTPLEAALAYARRGWRVVPLVPGERRPWLDEWQLAATTDEATIRGWWARTPASGVGIATGAASGVFVLDVDPRNGGDDALADLEAQHGSLPDTVETITGSNGRHIYFTTPDFAISIDHGKLLGPGLDVLGERAQAVAPPTVRNDGGTYTWEALHDPLDGIAVAEAPAWLLDLLRAAPAVEPRRAPAPRPDGELRAGDIFNARHTWPELLEPDGWKICDTRVDHRTKLPYELWTRPGKADGVSATLYYGGTELLKVFTSSVPGLAAGDCIDRFGYWARTRHGGKIEAAAAAYRRTLNAADDAMLVGGSDNGGHEIPSADTPPPPRRPRIVWNGRGLDDVTVDAVDALQAANEPPVLFVRAGQLTRLRQDEDERPLVDELRPEHAKLRLAEVADWHRALKDGGHVTTSPPAEIASTVLATGEWPLPALAGVVELPVLRPDGTFAVDHGYDPATRLYHWHRGDPYPDIPDQPSAAELADAVALVDEALCDFPWDTSADRANAWGLLLTPLVRAIVGQVPMALVDAPEPGTGKGKLISVVGIITMGRAAALMAWPATDEELEKKITATLMAGQTMIVFDNVEGIIRSGTLAAVLTADSWQGRVLGASKVVMVPNRATWAATGNNIDVGGDLARRCYRIRLDARQAQPWKRSGFRHPDLEHWVAANRGRLLHALCTIVRSWWVAGRPQADAIPAMGGYTPWVRTVGGILDHAGIADFLANLSEFHATADRDAQSWEAFLTAWSDELGEQSVTVAELIGKMKDLYTGHRLRDALPEELADSIDTGSFSKRLSLALRKRVGRHYGDTGVHLATMPRDRRQVAVYAVTTRSMELELGNAHHGDGANSRTPANEPQLPRELPRATTSGNDPNAGDAGVAQLKAGRENGTAENGGDDDPTNSRDSRTPAMPQPLELDDIFGTRSDQ